MPCTGRMRVAAWKSPKGETVFSFTMLTINADQHPVMNAFHKPTDEKRMVVILPPDRYDDWLSAPALQSKGYLVPYPASSMTAQGAEPVQLF